MNYKNAYDHLASAFLSIKEKIDSYQDKTSDNLIAELQAFINTSITGNNSTNTSTSHFNNEANNSSLLEQVVESLYIDTTNNLTKAIPEALEKLAKYTNAKSVYLIRVDLDEKNIEKEYEWHQVGFAFTKKELKYVDQAAIGIIARLAFDKNLKVIDAQYFEQHPDSEIKSIIPLSNQSLFLYIPLKLDNNVFYLLGLEHLSQQNTPSDNDIRSVTLAGKSVIHFIQQKRLANQSKSCKDEFGEIFEGTPISLLILDSDRRIVRVNKASRDLVTKTNNSQFVGLRCGEFLCCEFAFEDPRGSGFSPECEHCKLRHIIEDTFFSKSLHRAVEIQIPMLINNYLSTHYFKASTSPVIYNGQNMTLLALENVSEQKRFEKALQESNDRYKTIIEKANDAIFVADVESGIIVDVNKKAEELMGMPREKLIGIHQSKLHAEDSKEAMIERFNDDAKNTENPILRESHLYNTYGEKIPVEISPMSIKLEDGKDYLVGIFRDIRARKKAEEELRKSEQRHKLISSLNFDYVYSATYGDTNNLAIDWISGGFQKISGYGPEEFQDLYAYWKKVVHPSDFESFIAKMKNIRGDTIEEYRLVSRNGIEKWVREIIRFTYHEDGTPKNLIGSVRDITDKKLADLALVESERSYRLLFSELTAGYSYHEMIYDAQGRPADYKFIEVNRSFEKITGLKAADIIGKTVLEVLPATESYWIQKYGKVAITGEPITFENYSADLGRYYEVSAFSPKKDHFAVISLDVTDRITANRKVAASEKLYRSIIEAASDAVIISEALSGQIIEVNRKAIELTGFSLKQLKEMNLSELFSDSFGTIGQSTIHEAIIKTQQGTLVPVEINPALIDDDHNKKILIGFYRDISDRKNAEQKLKYERDFNKQIAETSPVGIVFLNENGDLEYANQKGLRILGANVEEAVQRNYKSAEWKITNFEGGPFPEEELPFIQVKKRQKAIFDIQHAIQLPDGQRRYLSINAAPVYGTLNNFKGAICTFEDITSKVLAAKAIQRRLEIEKLTSQISADLLGADPGMTHDTINDGLRKIAMITQCDNANLFVLDDTKQVFINQHKWLADNKPTDIEVEKITFDDAPWYITNMQNGRAVIFHSIKELPAKAEKEIGILKKLKIESFMSVPIRVKGETVGAISLGTYDHPKNWTDEDQSLLLLVGQTFMNAIKRGEAINALRDSEEKFRTVVTTTDTITWMMDENGVFTLSEGKGLSLLGLKPGEVVGLNAYEMYHDNDTLIETFQKVYTGESVSRIVHLGDLIMQIFCSPYINTDTKKVMGLIGVAIDITQKEKAEAEIRQKENELNRINTQIAEYKLTALRSAMNPHFVFNCLNSIQMYVTKNDRKPAIRYLSLFSKLIRSVLESSINRQISLERELEVLKYYVELEMMRFQDRFDIHLDIDGNIDKENTMVPSLFLQPYVENAIIHGLCNKLTHGNLRITLKQIDNFLNCTIEDDGIGRVAAQKINQQRRSNHTSMAMSVTEERLNIINKTNNVSVDIADLYNENNEPCGTRVVINLEIS